MKHIKPFLLPPQSGKHISPCDNSMFASLKSQIRKMDTSTTEKKKEAFLDCVRTIPEKK
jgi:hypothetical protein